MKLDININRNDANNDVMVARLVGRLDANTSPEFNGKLESLTRDFAEIQVDLSQLEYMSSAGLRAILLAKKWADRENIKFKVVNPKEEVDEVFSMTGFNRFVDIVHIGQEDEEGELQDSLGGFYPLRPIQRWMMDTHFQKANSTMMNEGGLAKLDDSIDMERLAGAINDTLAAHDIFRCRILFHPETGEISQRFDGTLSKVRIESLSEAEFEKRKLELKKPYQIIDRPLFRIYLIITPSGKYLYVDFYHVIMDGVATALLFFRELDNRYLGKPVKQPPYSYAEYIKEECAKPKNEAGAAYWHKMLTDFDESKHLPPSDKNEGSWNFNAHFATLQNIKKNFLKETKCPEHIFLLGAMMLAIAKSTGSRNAIMSYVHNGRTTRAEMRLMGLMLIQIPVRYDFDKDISVGYFLEDLERLVAEGFQYRDCLETVYNEGLEDECATFILQKGNIMGNVSGEFPLCGTVAIIQDLPQNKASAVENSLDIHVVCEDDGSYRLKLEYDASRYSEGMMERFATLVDEMIKGLQEKDKSVLELLS
ncbi:Non-ribosomal peptide synthetase [Anaerovibrio sp. JC8]|uniref:anti-sigma factor antagonist n=1 Tax=Anaerovibrio sp. JC8 TaxID=1240085 RepID=UPI000A0A9DD2|nr:anti-sigma factor antagonist [Anaerovibrio sp. JC8]ORT99974.1 Non-ribosomal peptide synthetase [Anaerovibrio sp. JC8]